MLGDVVRGDVVSVGGAFPGEVRWLDDCVALVWCNNHVAPDVVYSAACHEGADLVDVIAVPARDASGLGYWYVGPVECLRDLTSDQVWVEDIDEAEK